MTREKTIQILELYTKAREIPSPKDFDDAIKTCILVLTIVGEIKNYMVKIFQ